MAPKPSTLLALVICLAALALPAQADGTLAREAGFIHRLFEPERPSGRVMILMHGSGGDETTLVALASKIAPDATLIGVRGRVVQDGVQRWYRRLTPTEFDQQDVRAEAEAFVAFLHAMASERRLDLSAATFLGYSNGANLIAALTQLHPELIRRAVLLRPMPVLTGTANVDLSETRFLTIAGDSDRLYFPFAPKLEALLRGCGANVDARIVAAGHGLGDEDARIVAEWLGSPAK